MPCPHHPPHRSVASAAAGAAIAAAATPRPPRAPTKKSSSRSWAPTTAARSSRRSFAKHRRRRNRLHLRLRRKGHRQRHRRRNFERRPRAQGHQGFPPSARRQGRRRPGVRRPNHWHAPATILACAAGKHVYVEKPASHTPPKASCMIAAARKAQPRRADRHPAPQHPHYIEAIERIRDGAIGRVLFAQLVVLQQPPLDRPRQSRRTARVARLRPLARPRARAAVPRQHHPLQLALVLALGQRRARQQRRPHDRRLPLGPGRRLSRRASPPPAAATATTTTRKRPTRTSSRFDFDGRKHRLGRPQLVAAVRATPGGISIELRGDKGTIVIDDSGYKLYDVETANSSRSKAATRGDAEHLANFLDCRPQRRKAQLPTIEEGHKSTLLCHLGNIAYRTGRRSTSTPPTATSKTTAKPKPSGRVPTARLGAESLTEHTKGAAIYCGKLFRRRDAR